MQAVAVGWELFARTHSAWNLGLVGLTLFAPVLVLSLPAGHAADHYSRKAIAAAALVGSAAASLVLAYLSYTEGPYEWMFACLLAVGVCQAFSSPARRALLPQAAPPGALANAVTWNSSSWQAANLGGPPLGTGVIALAGAAWPVYLLAAAAAVGAAGLLAAMHPRAPAAGRRGFTLTELLAGVRFIGSTPLILAAISLDLFAVLFGGATALLPIFAKDILQVGPVGFGWLRASPALGALLMAVVLAYRPPLRRAGVALLGAVAGFGLATIVFGFSTSPALSFVMLALTGALDNVSVVVRGALTHRLTPEAMRGRVSAVSAIFVTSSNELGAFESGATAAWWGPTASVVGGGVGSLLVVMAAMVLCPALTRLGPLDAIGEDAAAALEDAPAPRRETMGD
jgi:MFS family permease